MNTEDLVGRLNRMMRLRTAPVGVKFLSPKEPLPPGALRPAKYGIRISLCQWTTLARTWGRMAAVQVEDINCTPCLAAMGWMRLENPGDLARYFMDMGYFESPELAESALAQLDPLPAGAVSGLVMAPLEPGCDVAPDLVWIYGTPARMARLAAGWVYRTGELVSSTTTGFGISCLSMVKPHFTGKPVFVHPGRGERILAGTDEGEMAFSFPAARLADLVEGLEKTHEKGNRYPVQKYVIYEPPLLRPLEALGKRLSPVD
ncbi:MAG: DUF169 domain-containing protein [Desulfobacterales bacterium]|jgi:uncharacterized protein (DUF169 family)